MLAVPDGFLHHCSLRLLRSVVRQRFVTMSPCKSDEWLDGAARWLRTLRRTLKVWSRRGSGRHARSASLALEFTSAHVMSTRSV